MGKTAKDVMNKAISFLGVKESPANSNNVVFNTDYYGRSVSGSAYPWCCAFVWDVFRLASASELFYDGRKTAYCPTVESWGKQSNLTVDKSKGEYGDIVLFDFTGKGISGHIGLIVSKNQDGTYKTIEGNTGVGNDANGGCVMYRTRPISTIRCIIRPKYKKSSTKTYTDTFPNLPARGYFKKGDKGQNVKNLQKFLNWAVNSGLAVDGDFGEKTYNAVITFQKKVFPDDKSQWDGEFGKKSLEKAKKYKK